MFGRDGRVFRPRTLASSIVRYGTTNSKDATNAYGSFGRLRGSPVALHACCWKTSPSMHPWRNGSKRIVQGVARLRREHATIPQMRLRSPILVCLCFAVFGCSKKDDPIDFSSQTQGEAQGAGAVPSEAVSPFSSPAVSPAATSVPSVPSVNPPKPDAGPLPDGALAVPPFPTLLPTQLPSSLPPLPTLLPSAFPIPVPART